MVNRSQGADNRPRSGSTVAQLWRGKLPAIVAKHSPVDANPRHRLVAEALADHPAATKALVSRCAVSAHREDRERQRAKARQATKAGAGVHDRLASSCARPAAARENELRRGLRDDDPGAWSIALLSGASDRLDLAAAHPTV